MQLSIYLIQLTVVPHVPCTILQLQALTLHGSFSIFNLHGKGATESGKQKR